MDHREFSDPRHQGLAPEVQYYAKDVFEVESLHDWRESNYEGEEFQVLCKWRGYDLDDGETGWVDIEELREGAKSLVADMLTEKWEGKPLSAALKKYVEDMLDAG